MLVEHDDVLAADQAGDRPHVGEHHRRKDQHRLDPEPVGEFFLGVDIGPNAGEGPRRAVMRSPSSQTTAHGLLDARVAVETEEAVGAEVDDPAAEYLDLSPGPLLFDHKVFEMRIGMFFAEFLNNLYKRISAQGVAELGHGRTGGHDVSLRGEARRPKKASRRDPALHAGGMAQSSSPVPGSAPLS